MRRSGLALKASEQKSGPPAGPEETLTFLSDGPESTACLGAWLGKEASAGDLIALTGPLGAGKTHLVQGLASGLGVANSYVNSPTFILVQVHQGRLSLYHIDLYRLESGAELDAIGLEEYLEGDGVAAVEWADQGTALLPPDRLAVDIRFIQERDGTLRESERKIVLAARGPRSRAWLDRTFGSRPLDKTFGSRPLDKIRSGAEGAS